GDELLMRLQQRVQSLLAKAPEHDDGIGSRRVIRRERVPGKNLRRTAAGTKRGGIENRNQGAKDDDFCFHGCSVWPRCPRVGKPCVKRRETARLEMDPARLRYGRT